MLTGLLFAASLVILLRYIRPERLMRVESLPDITGFFATLQSPVTPLLPSFWAGETLFATLQGGRDFLHLAALWTTAGSMMLLLRAAHERWHFGGYSNAQEARKARFTKLHSVDRVAALLPLSTVQRQLLVKDAKVFFRDVSQWSQLLLLVALMLVYLYNFRVLDLDRIPFVSGVIKNVYAFVNLGMAGLVMATVAVRFVFPGVSSEGAAFWIVRTAPVSLRDFLWSKFWIGLVPVLVLTEALTVAGNHLLGVDPFLKGVGAVEHPLHERRACRPGDRTWCALSTIQRRQRKSGGRVVRRNRLHGDGGAVRARHRCPRRLAVIGVPLSPGAAPAASARPSGWKCMDVLPRLC